MYTIGSPNLICPQEDFCVSLSTKNAAGQIGQLLAQLQIVIDLSIKSDPVSAIQTKRLVALRMEVDNRKATMAQTGVVKDLNP
jgi:hypothetical protein